MMGALGGLLVMLGALLSPATAEACSPRSWAISLYTMPTDGSADVPINAVVLLSYVSATGELICDPDRCDPDVLTDVALVAEGGETIPSTIDAHLTDVWPWLRVVPDAPLSPSTRYQIWSRMAPRLCDYDCVRPTREVIATFETGTRTDTSAPAFGGLGHIEESRPSGASGTECGHFSGIRFSLYWTEAIDEDATAYRVEIDGLSVGMALPGQPPPTGFVLCAGYPDVSFGARATRGPYHVAALDLAGNEDDNTVTMGVSECPPMTVGDAGAAAPMSEGCSIGGVPTYNSALWIALVAATMRRLNARARS